LFEEVWGEVDHVLNYPQETLIVACREQLRVLAKVVGAGTRLVDSIFRSIPPAQVAVNPEVPAVDAGRPAEPTGESGASVEVPAAPVQVILPTVHDPAGAVAARPAELEMEKPDTDKVHATPGATPPAGAGHVVDQVDADVSRNV